MIPIVKIGHATFETPDLGRQIENCTNDTDAWYVLSFDSTHPDGTNEYHKLDVRMGKTGLTARTRTGYYPQPR